MLQDYVLLRTTDAPKVKIGKNVRYPLVASAVPKGVRVMTNIIPNIQKMGFVDHDLCKFPELAMYKYLTTF